MKSLMPRFSRKTPEEAVVLNRKEISALSSPWKVGKWRYDVSLSKNAAFQKFSEKQKRDLSNLNKKSKNGTLISFDRIQRRNHV